MRLPTRVLSFVAALHLVAGSAAAQGRVGGTVKDENDKPIKGATVTAENPNAAPSSFVVTTDAKGRFALLGLRAGIWVFTLEAPGFETAQLRVSTRTMGLNAPIDVKLQRREELPPRSPVATADVAELQQRLDEASALADGGNVDEAIERYREILTDLPVLTSVHLQLGSLYERKQDVAAAVAEYDALLKADPDNAKARAALDRLTRQ
jgi:tetratricopeptide (TPR) repeat protein